MQRIARSCSQMFLLICAMVVILGAALHAKQAKKFTQGDLIGSYGFSFDGEVVEGPDIGPLAAVGRFEADGEGNLSGVRTLNLNGIIAEQTAVGAYEVNGDGTGYAFFVISTPGLPDSEEAFRFVLSGSGSGLQFISASPGVVTRGVATRLSEPIPLLDWDIGIRLQQQQGCGPGYWKNHTDSWAAAGYSPAQSVASVFSQSSAYPDVASASLLEALKFRGGGGVEGGARILLRAAVASLLNAAHPGVDFPRTPASIISSVNAALASGDRETMLSLASSLDFDNKAGCPLN